MKLKVKKEEIKDFIKEMVKKNHNVRYSTEVVDFIYTHHKLDNLDNLSKIIKTYETIDQNKIFNDKYLNKVVINEMRDGSCYPTVCMLKEDILNTPFVVDNDGIICEVSLPTLCECISENPRLTKVALERDEWGDTKTACSLDDIKKSLEKYIIVSEYYYLKNTFFEDYVVLATDGYGNALLIHNSQITDKDKESIPYEA